MLELFFSASGAGTCIVLMMLIVKDSYHSVAARAFLVLIFGGFVHLCHNWLPQSFSSYAYMVESATPAFFWISCRLIFQEGRKLPFIGFAIALYSFIPPIVTYFITMSLGEIPTWLNFIGRVIPQWLEYTLIIMGLITLLRRREDDLVESRRRLRWAIMGAAGLSLGWSVFSFNFHFGSAASRILAIDISLLIIIGFLFKGRSDIWGIDNAVIKVSSIGTSVNNAAALDGGLNAQYSPSEADGHQARESADEQLKESEELVQVNTVMLQGFYRQEKLTLKDLAVELGLPEYKVRAVINKELGYRNFNEFINEYRITEAAQRLISEPDTPISNIALDVGYRTLSSFNRAFRKEKDTTPTAYRELG